MSRPPFPEPPDGILPFRRPANRSRFGMSSTLHSRATIRTPQLMSNPTPPGEIEPPCSPQLTSVARTPPIGNPYPKCQSAIAQASPTTPGIDAILTSCDIERSSLLLARCAESATIIASTFIDACWRMRISPSPSTSRCLRHSPPAMSLRGLLSLHFYVSIGDGLKLD